MIICVGGAVLDRKYRLIEPVVMATSNPAEGFRSFGGVGRNICENLARLGADVAFVSVVGDDENGRTICEHLTEAGADTRWVSHTEQGSTAEYVALLQPDNELAIGIADMAIFERLTEAVIEPAISDIEPDDWVLFDCNLPAKTIKWLAEQRMVKSFRLACDTVSTLKATKIAPILSAIDLLFTNSDEARAIVANGSDRSAPLAALREAGVATVVLTRGAAGPLVADADGIRHVPAMPALPVDVTGAGDALVAGTLFAITRSASIDQAVGDGVLLATLTIESSFSVLPDLSTDFLSAARARMRVQAEKQAKT
jgi:pseudouridine kinase